MAQEPEWSRCQYLARRREADPERKENGGAARAMGPDRVGQVQGGAEYAEGQRELRKLGMCVFHEWHFTAWARRSFLVGV